MRPTHSVATCSRARAASASTSRARVGQDQLADALDLQRQPGVEHVARGQAVVDPAPGGAGRRRQDVDERRDVVVGDLLALLDLGDRERGGADRLQLGRRSGRPSPRRPPPRPRASRRSAPDQTRSRPARGGCSARSPADCGARLAAPVLTAGAGSPAALRIVSSRPGKRASRSSRRSVFRRVVPCWRCWIRPASRSTLKWCVQVDLVTGSSKLPQVHSPPLGELGDDHQAHRIAERVQHGAELELCPRRMSDLFGGVG